MLTFKLTPQMVEVIGKALGVQPYDTVAPVVAELQRQINEQQQAQMPAPPVAPIEEAETKPWPAG